MIKSHIKSALRNLLKNKSYALINISGLAIGIACCLLIVLFVQNELSYDSFHEKAERIYRVVRYSKKASRGSSTTSSPMVPALRDAFPQIQNAVSFGRDDVLVMVENNRFQEELFFWTDETVFEVFSFPMVSGNPATALAAPNSIVLTEKMAEKYFGEADPLGKTLGIKIFDGNRLLTMTVTGIVAQPPANSHLRFNFLASMKTADQIYPRFAKWWSLNWLRSYIQLPENYDPNIMTKEFPALVDKFMGHGTSASVEWRLQPLSDIHLNSQLRARTEPPGAMAYVYIFSAIAFFVLILACINYMNLITVQSSRRVKEFGVRKAIGGERLQIARQFMGEILLSSCLAMLLAVVLTELALPVFSTLAEKDLSLSLHQRPMLLFGMIALCICITLLSGSYPTLLVTCLHPVEMLRGKALGYLKKSNLRNALVVFQFVTSIVLIAFTTTVYSQLDFMKNKNLGFEMDQILLVPIKDRTVQSKIDLIISEFSKPGSVKGVAQSSEEFPGKMNNSWGVEWDGLSEDDKRSMYVVAVDENFFDLLEIEFVEGRNFSTDFATDAQQAFILNEAAAQSMGPDYALNMPFRSGGRDGQIVGVVKNYHFQSLHREIAPVVFLKLPGTFRASPDNILVKVAPDDLASTIATLARTWGEFSPHQPFEYYFLDENFAQVYAQEENFGKIVGYFSMLAIFIACLGLSGLAAFSAQQRTQEVGIRKVLGSSTSGIIRLLSKEFLRVVAIANLIAWPLAYFLMNKWLEDFAYRADVSWPVFVLSGSLALLVALLTVGAQALKTAVANPVDSLRYE